MSNARFSSFYGSPSAMSVSPAPIGRPRLHSHRHNMSVLRNQTSQPAYAESTYSTSTTYSEKPLMNTSSSEQRQSKRSRAWQKTKDLLAKIPEPERQQKPALTGPETEEEQLKRLRRSGELDYGTYQGGPHSGRISHR